MESPEKESADELWTVEKALAAHSIHLPPNPSSPIPFFHILSRLKTTKRQGWRRYGIHDGESIADHMHRMAVMVLFAPPAVRQSLDVEKCLKMALLHDVAESVVGDLTPMDGVPKAEKKRRESITIDYFARHLLGSSHGGDEASAADMRAVWHEFEDAASEESQFVQDLDKVELLLQMVEYEKSENVDLGEFAYVATKVRLPAMQRWADEILAERQPIAAEKSPGAVASTKQQQDQYYGET